MVSPRGSGEAERNVRELSVIKNKISLSILDKKLKFSLYRKYYKIFVMKRQSSAIQPRYVEKFYIKVCQGTNYLKCYVIV